MKFNFNYTLDFITSKRKKISIKSWKLLIKLENFIKRKFFLKEETSNVTFMCIKMYIEIIFFFLWRQLVRLFNSNISSNKRRERRRRRKIVIRCEFLRSWAVLHNLTNWFKRRIIKEEMYVTSHHLSRLLIWFTRKKIARKVAKLNFFLSVKLSSFFLQSTTILTSFEMKKKTWIFFLLFI